MNSNLNTEKVLDFFDINFEIIEITFDQIHERLADELNIPQSTIDKVIQQLVKQNYIRKATFAGVTREKQYYHGSKYFNLRKKRTKNKVNSLKSKKNTNESK